MPKSVDLHEPSPATDLKQMILCIRSLHWCPTKNIQAESRARTYAYEHISKYQYDMIPYVSHAVVIYISYMSIISADVSINHFSRVCQLHVSIIGSYECFEPEVI